MGELAETINVPTVTVNKNITVKFKLNDFQIIAQVYKNCLTIEAVKNDLGEKFKVDPKYFHLFQETELLSNNLRLSDVQPNYFYIIELELKLNDLAKKYNKTCSENEKIELSADIFYR